MLSVSMYECYTIFLLMFRKEGKCIWFWSINDIKRVGVGWGWGLGWGRLVRASGEGSRKAVFFRGRIFQVRRERHTVRIAGTMNV